MMHMQTPAPADLPAYFHQFQSRQPPEMRSLTATERSIWQLLAAMTVGFGLWYLQWRWFDSLNTEALGFSILVALAETATFLGTCLFFFDIWDESDTPRRQTSMSEALITSGNEGKTEIDIFIATLDEDAAIVAPTIDAARALAPVSGHLQKIWLLDDGNRSAMRALAAQKGINYLARTSNRGFKAGNLAHALFQSRGAYIVICDADTQLFPSFLQNTLGYFADPKVAWVQPPHWFFDLPEGQSWPAWCQPKFGRFARPAAWILQGLSGTTHIGRDPFISDPAIFFDIIQRRRNRHSASFCCGAGSIHRRDALFENCLSEHQDLLTKTASRRPSEFFKHAQQQPFKHHVSEDIFTSIQLHDKGWKSVFHPQIEARMLSPWSVKAWAAQRLKYAGGTYDIMLRANPFFSRSMPFTIKLHYLATFWSYASVLWFPVLLLAPVYSLITGIAPIDAYTFTFFIHLLPVLLCNELALMAGVKGYDTYGGRCMSLGTLPIQVFAFMQVLRGRRPKFAATPKTPSGAIDLRYALPNLVLITALVAAAIWGITATYLGSEAHSLSLLTVNLFWVACNILLLGRVVLACLSTPGASLPPHLQGDLS